MCARVYLTETMSSCTGGPSRFAWQVRRWHGGCSEGVLGCHVACKFGGHSLQSYAANSTAHSAWQGQSLTCHVEISVCLIYGQVSMALLSAQAHMLFCFVETSMPC